MTENTGEGGLDAQVEAQVPTPEERLAADPALEPELAHERDETGAEERAEEAEEQAETD
jgi:hypothetical protein